MDVEDDRGHEGECECEDEKASASEVKLKFTADFEGNLRYFVGRTPCILYCRPRCEGQKNKQVKLD